MSILRRQLSALNFIVAARVKNCLAKVAQLLIALRKSETFGKNCFKFHFKRSQLCESFVVRKKSVKNCTKLPATDNWRFLIQPLSARATAKGRNDRFFCSGWEIESANFSQCLLNYVT